MTKQNLVFSVFTSLLIALLLLVSCTSKEETTLSNPVDKNQTSETTTVKQSETELETTPEEDIPDTEASEPDVPAQIESETGTEDVPTTDNSTSELPVKVDTGPLGKLILEKVISSVDGGSVSVDEGKMTLEFPANSLPEDTDIKVRVLSQQDIPEDARALKPLGDIYNFGPDGLQLNEPATLTMILEPEEISGPGLTEGSYPFLLAFIRDADGMWDIAESINTEVDPETCSITVTASISHFSEVYITSALGATANISPDSVVGDIGGVWNGEITVSYIPEHGVADYVHVREIKYKTAPNTVVVVLGNQSGDVTQVMNGETKTLTPDPRYMCQGAGKGWYGAEIVIQIVDALRYFYEIFGLEATHGTLLQLRREDGSPGELIYGARLTVKGNCECQVDVSPTPPPSTSPPPCFAGDTLILMDDGSVKYIRDIQVGEKVKAYDTQISSIVAGTVMALNGGEADFYYLINGSLKVTPPHPFYTTSVEWVKIEDLQIGDEILTSSGKVTIESIEKIYTGIQIYNISVAEYNNFFVSGDGEYFYLVHQGS